MRTRRKGHRLKRFGFKISLYKKVRSNLIIGIFRGIGVSLGFTLLSAIFLFTMQIIPLNKIPFVSKILEEFNRIITRR